MKIFRLFIMLFLFLSVTSCTMDMAQLMEYQDNGSGLTEDEVVRGIMEALKVGTKRAVEKGGRLNGYYGNPAIRIPLPQTVKKIKNVLEFAGMSGVVRDFEKSMNRAAEKAAPKAADIFWDALKEMTLADAWGILNGGDHAATDYFRRKTYSRLEGLFRPMVHRSMSAVGVTSYYQQIERKVNSLPVKLMDTDLDGYVTGKALDGIFHLLSEEEKKIRKDPVARTSEILKKVFG